MLRKSNEITELAYIRLPFRNLFKAIQKLYEQQNGINKEFECYRGGWISH